MGEGIEKVQGSGATKRVGGRFNLRALRGGDSSKMTGNLQRLPGTDSQVISSRHIETPALTGMAIHGYPTYSCLVGMGGLAAYSSEFRVQGFPKIIPITDSPSHMGLLEIGGPIFQQPQYSGIFANCNPRNAHLIFESTNQFNDYIIPVSITFSIVCPM